MAKNYILPCFLHLKSWAWHLVTFLCFKKFFFHHNWNAARLLVINMVYTSWFTSNRTTLDIGSSENRKYQENLKTSLNNSLVPKLTPKIKIFVNTSKKLLNNRNWTFPAMCYFTWKLEFVSNILSMIVERETEYVATILTIINLVVDHLFLIVVK